MTDPVTDEIAETDPSAYPVARLRPNKGKAYLGGHPWVYKDELVLDRRTGKIEPGMPVVLEDAKRVPVGVVALNSGSGIAARDLDRDPRATVDAAWIAARLGRALALRERVYPKPFYRLVHAEADGLPGLVIDRMDGLLVIQPNTAWAEAMLPHILATLDDLLSPETVVVNRDSRGRTQEGMEGGREVVRGALDGPVAVETATGRLHADIQEGQKTGVYFDQFPNHAFVASLAKDKRVLDVFAHTGGFALAALGAGAASALAVDGSARALELAEKAARDSDVADRFATRQGDAFDTMRALTAEGETFDIVVCDPPAFAPRKETLEAGLRAYERVTRLALPLVAEGGILTVCSCSHVVTPDMLMGTAMRMLHRAHRRGRLIHSGRAGADHPVHPALAESGYLKVLVFALD